MRKVVNVTRSGRDARARDIPFWVTAGACVLLTCAVLAALAILHAWSVNQESGSQSMAALRTAVAVEQEGVLDSVTTRVALQADANAALRVVETTDASDSVLPSITRMADDYQAAVSIELAGIRAGAPQSANDINAQVGETRFTPLSAQLASESREESASAASGVTIAFAASIAMVVGAGLVAMLFALFARRRRTRILAAEAKADQHEQDSRIAATRAETFTSLFDENPQPMLVTRLPAAIAERGDLQFLAVNKAAEAMYGYSRAEFLGLRLDGIRHCTKGGRTLDIEVDTREMMFNGENAMIVCPSDVTDRKRLRRDLEHQALHDALTGLANRSLFRDRLQHAHQRLERSGGSYAVLMLDLDNFKTVNDSLGHAAGDDLLVRVSERLSASVGSGDTAARLGGDEFAILLEDLAEPGDAPGAAELLRTALRAPFLIAGRSLTVTVTIGVASSIGADAAADVSRNADVALYVGKADGKDRCALFTDAMYASTLERMTLEQDLRAGIGRGELVLLYQPKVDSQTGKLSGVEALVRWNHPSRGLIPPDAFIPIAEQSGLINELDTWVLTAACSQAKAWSDACVDPVPVAVNVSGRSLVSCKLLERVVDALRQTGLDPHLLELEITESAAVPQQGEALGLLQTIRDLGVRVAIDDFGTGYSVLSRLLKFPVDTLKIDLTFTRAIVAEHQPAPIVDAMIAMGLSLGLKVVAEGVETEVQRRYLATRRCTELQGYLISRPVAPDEIVARFARTRTTTAVRLPALV
jgi:diguanylate cyclase (GGDEF)-like protein